MNYNDFSIHRLEVMLSNATDVDTKVEIEATIDAKKAKEVSNNKVAKITSNIRKPVFYKTVIGKVIEFIKNDAGVKLVIELDGHNPLAVNTKNPDINKSVMSLTLKQLPFVKGGTLVEGCLIKADRYVAISGVTQRYSYETGKVETHQLKGGIDGTEYGIWGDDLPRVTTLAAEKELKELKLLNAL
jgi:hypothetical protein